MSKEKPTLEEYRERKLQVALDYSPVIYPCCKCGNPVARGYICGWCGNTNPSKKEDNENG